MRLCVETTVTAVIRPIQKHQKSPDMLRFKSLFQVIQPTKANSSLHLFVVRGNPRDKTGKLGDVIAWLGLVNTMNRE